MCLCLLHSIDAVECLAGYYLCYAGKTNVQIKQITNTVRVQQDMPRKWNWKYPCKCVYLSACSAWGNKAYRISTIRLLYVQNMRVSFSFSFAVVFSHRKWMFVDSILSLGHYYFEKSNHFHNMPRLTMNRPIWLLRRTIYRNVFHWK